MESPIKKLDFGVANKENKPLSVAEFMALSDKAAEQEKPAVEEVKKDEKETSTAISTIKSLEDDEPLLQENPSRFVLFPIKYHEVRDAS